MRLPGSDRAVVDAAKVRDYLLSPEHPVGRFKARVFLAVGYRRDDWQRLQRDLLTAARTMHVEPAGSSGFGQRYVGDVTLVSPSGAPLPLTAIWIIRSGGRPHLVTAYPRSPE